MEDRRDNPGRRRSDPSAERLVDLVTQVLGSLEGIALAIGEVRKEIAEQNKRTDGGH